MMEGQDLREAQEQEIPWWRNGRTYLIGGLVTGGTIAGAATLDFITIRLPVDSYLEWFTYLLKGGAVATLGYIASQVLERRAAPRAPEEIEYRMVPREELERLGEPQQIHHRERFADGTVYVRSTGRAPRPYHHEDIIPPPQQPAAQQPAAEPQAPQQ